jgi:predicted AAA+ superfamily ATPase
MGSQPQLYFWRDKNGYAEIDCIIDRGGILTPVEIKSGETVISGFWDSLNKWNEIAGNDKLKSYLVYGGNLTQTRQNGNLIGWQNSAKLIDKINKK